MYSEVCTCIQEEKRVITRFNSFSRYNRYMTPKVRRRKPPPDVSADWALPGVVPARDFSGLRQNQSNRAPRGTHAIWTVLKAGETGYRTGEVPKSL